MIRRSLLVLALVVSACGPSPEAQEAERLYRACINRNGVVAEGVQVELDSDGRIETVTATYLNADDIDLAQLEAICRADVDSQ